MRLFKRQPKREIVCHPVGMQITFNKRSRQLCMWCGVIIEDKDWTKIPVPVVEGKTEEQVKQEMFEGTWGGLVALDLNGMPFHVQPNEDGTPPDNCCVWK